MTRPRSRYLFIRILEACNADCFMCEYALSRDGYRFSPEEFRQLLPLADQASVGFVRFTGGEPLMHRDIVGLVRLGSGHGLKMSLITNGLLLPRMIGPLTDAGLDHVVVSIDGASAGTHDVYRRSSGAFANSLAGLRKAIGLGVITRVNSVVGPHNYAQMADLQRLLSEIGVHQWELSALKLERPIVYPDPDGVRRTCDPIYAGTAAGLLVPLGKRFYGDTPAEQELFFGKSITPRASRPLCHVTDDVIYLDARQGRGYACSCIAHRDPGGDRHGATLRSETGWQLQTAQFAEHAAFYREHGPLACTGCSTTAAGYSDDIARMGEAPAWRH